MKIEVLGGSGGMSPGKLLISFRIDDRTILDAGSVAQALPLDEQARIEHILLTHAHLDHSGTLPFLVDNIFGVRDDAFVVHAIPETIRSIREHLFNDDIWPDFARLPTFEKAQIRFDDLPDSRAVECGRHRVTAVRVNHTVPSAGFLVEVDGASVVFSGDTAATDELWELASSKDDLAAAFIETSFPNAMQKIADVSGHLTPRTLAAELPKLDRDVPIFIYHIKPRFRDEVVRELKDIRDRDLRIAEQGRVYEL